MQKAEELFETAPEYGTPPSTRLVQQKRRCICFKDGVLKDESSLFPPFPFLQEAEELFETVSQALLSGQDRDCLAGWGAVVYVM